MDPNANISLTFRLEEAVALLVPTQEILNKFNYRHKNQHRLSKWWAGFDMLRRHTTKLCRDEIRPALDALAKQESVQNKTKKQSKRQRTQPRVEDIASASVAKAKWMGEYLIPQVYMTITQLAADNQFAHLGLLLLGVLAQVHSAVSLLLLANGTEQEVDAATADEGEGIDVGVAVSRPKESGQVRKPLPPALQSGSKAQDDLGELVTRDSYDAKRQDSGSRIASQDCSDAVVTTVVNRKRPPKDARKREKVDKSPSGYHWLSNGYPSAISESVGEERPKHNAKKAQKEVSVESTEKPKKKQKRKKGDEFDELFSSLM